MLTLSNLCTPALPGILKSLAVKIVYKGLGEADTISGEGLVTLLTPPCSEGVLTVNKPSGDGFLQVGNSI